jgi:hypothetical protein
MALSISEPQIGLTSGCCRLVARRLPNHAWPRQKRPAGPDDPGQTKGSLMTTFEIRPRNEGYTKPGRCAMLRIVEKFG